MFKIKDLMIKVVPQGVDIPGGNQGWCGFCTHGDSCGACTCTCSFGCTHCSAGSSIGQPGDIVSNPNPEGLAALKAQLQRQLAAVEEAEKRMEPQSLEEVELAEKKVREALAELEQMKAKFKKPRG
jgi:hypothetical protein